jgi:uncharacterized phage-associated protein
MNAPLRMNKRDQPRLIFKPKFDKMIELLLYLAHKRPNADQYQAVKFFYLADKEHLNKFGRPITYEQYYALPYGPVASNVYNLLKAKPSGLKAFSLKNMDKLPFVTQELGELVYIIEPKRAVEYDLFSKSDIGVFDDVLREYGNKSFKELYNITHKHFAYTHAWGDRGTTKSAPISYDDMLEESQKKAAYIEDFEPVALSLNENR